MQSWALSLTERVMLLKLWILPLLVYPARLVFTSPAVANTLRTVYQVALKLNSWAVTLNILSHPPLSVPKVLHNSFQPFAQDLGILVSPASLPFFQIGSNVIKKNMPYLGWCTRAFSLVKKDICFEEPALLSYDTPLWHSTLF